jgi:hypothetical protein
MWTSIRRSRAAHATRSRRVGVAVALLTCVGLTACTATEPPSPASTAEADTIAPLPKRGDLDPGTYLVTGYPVPFEITVPDGWGSFDDGSGVANEGGVVYVFFYPTPYVPTDACAWQGALVQIDPTAEAFVDAMTAQTSLASTPPIEVMVGDYSGFEFDLSMEGDVESSDCDGDQICIYSASAQDCDGRYYTGVLERETYRVVDLNGERAVIAVGHWDESVDPALIEEARAVFDSIVFVGPDE